MGMFRSKLLDFETVCNFCRNEGILPAGKSNNSFIPFDVKIENNLPTYKRKDTWLHVPLFYVYYNVPKHIFFLQYRTRCMEKYRFSLNLKSREFTI
jgi:inactivated superfamily I helicase